MLCEYCINLSTIFSDPSTTQRSEIKASVSNITHHNLLSLLKSSKTCVLCSLIVAAIPCYHSDLRWIGFEVMMNILQVEYGRNAQIKKRFFHRRLGQDDWFKKAFEKWIIYLRNPSGNSRESVAQFSLLAGEYYNEAARLRVLGVVLPSIVLNEQRSALSNSNHRCSRPRSKQSNACYI
jgi:hypothetical protein